jgi:c-di-GMP-binding flagellar brake protein YcgR
VLTKQKSIGLTGVDLVTEENVRSHILDAFSGDYFNVEATNPAGKKMRARLNYVGAIGDEYLLFIYPDARRFGDMYSVLLTGCHIVGRCVDERRGRVIAFRSQVHSAVAHPVKLLCMEFPKQVQVRDIRTSRRIHAEIPVQCLLGQTQYRSTLLDISRGGGLLALRQGDGVELGQELLLSFSFEQQQFQKQVRVCSVKPQSESVLVGLAFSSPLTPEEEQIALHLLWQA